MKRIGFAGLGRMGQHMVRNLVKAGFDVCVWNRSEDKSDAIAKELGICCVKHPCNLTEQSEIIITMLSDDNASMAVHTGENGLFARVGANYFVEMGTMSPSHINDLVNAADERVIIDAPVSGATNAAKDAQLMVMLGSDKANAEPIIPALKAMSRKLVFLGASGAGATMKLSVNMLIHNRFGSTDVSGSLRH